MKEEGGKDCCKLSLSTNNMAKLSLTQQISNYVAELMMDPSRNEILLVRFQELQTNAFPMKINLQNFLVFHWAWSLTNSQSRRSSKQ